jgi:hypothetical protein
MLLSLLVWSCGSLHTENRFCFLLSFSRRGKKFAAFRLIFKSPVKMCRHIPHYWARRLPTLTILCHPHGCFDAPFSDMTMGDLNVQNLEPKSDNLWKVNATKMWLLYCWRHQEIVLKLFVSLRSCLLTVKTKRCKFSVPYVLSFHWATTFAERTRNKRT